MYYICSIAVIVFVFARLTNFIYVHKLHLQSFSNPFGLFFTLHAVVFVRAALFKLIVGVVLCSASKL